MASAHTQDAQQRHAAADDAADPGDPLTDLLEYAHASGDVMRDRARLWQSRIRLSLLQLFAGAVGAMTAIVLLLSGWILAMVGLSQVLAVWLESAALSALLVAATNVIAGLLALWFARTMMRRAASFSPVDGSER